jgi:PAS domain S-box-containing protein
LDIHQTDPTTTMTDTEALLRAWIDSVKDYAIFLVDTGGNVSSWNEGAERILGYRESEILGEPCAVLFTPEDIDRGIPEKEIGEALRTGRASDDRWHVRKNGSRFWASGILTRVEDADGAFRGFVKALRDLTERKHVEDELRRQAEALQQADRRKNEFLAMLSHELRNPLAPILNSTYVLRQQIRSDDPIVEQARATIERQVTHLKRMVDDLLDVSRVAMHKVHLRKERVDLSEVIRRAVEDVATSVAERRHDLSVSLDPEPILLEADPTRLEQIVVNLLANAVKYTEPGGSIWLSTRREGAGVVIRVRDTGIGLEPAMRLRIFDLFVQANQAPERAQGGLGIGLSLTRSLVEMHDGRIEAHSEGLGKGSEFLVRLPILPPKPPADAAAGADPSRAKPPPMRLILIEDNADAARTLGLLLQWAGHEVHIAHDGRTGIELVRESQPDVVLLDIGLPGMNGFEVARALRCITPARLVAMTGYARDPSACDDLDDYLVKPVNPDDLIRLLAKIADSR